MKLFLIRHAPTAANAGRVFMGQSDVPAAPFTAEPLPRSGPRAIWSSPLSRARVAAEALFPGEPISYDERLLERSVGEWAGLDHATVSGGWPDAFLAPGVLNHELTPPGGETLDQVVSRVSGFLADLPHEPTSYVVTHNGWIRIALMLAGVVRREDLFAEPVPFLEPIAVTLPPSLR